MLTNEIQNVSETYIKKWERFAYSRDGTHAKLAYDWYGSWTTLYSLYSDAILCFHPSINNGDDDITTTTTAGTTSTTTSATSATTVVAQPTSKNQQPFLSGSAGAFRLPLTEDFIPARVYHKQSKWYSIVLQKYGLPLDSRHLYTKSDWEFEAAAVASKSTRAQILNCVAKWVNETVTDRPLTDLYQTEGKGEFPGPNFFARPVVGGHFAFLALERACGGNGKAYQALGFDE